MASLVLQEIENYSAEIIRKAQSSKILEIKKVNTKITKIE